MELAAIMNESESIKDWIIDIRRELHRFPELMYEEHRTNALVREKLDVLGIEYDFPIAETGVLASIGNGDGPCIALRARRQPGCRKVDWSPLCHFGRRGWPCWSAKDFASEDRW